MNNESEENFIKVFFYIFIFFTHFHSNNSNLFIIYFEILNKYKNFKKIDFILTNYAKE